MKYYKALILFGHKSEILYQLVYYFTEVKWKSYGFRHLNYIPFWTILTKNYTVIFSFLFFFFFFFFFFCSFVAKLVARKSQETTKIRYLQIYTRLKYIFREPSFSVLLSRETDTGVPLNPGPYAPPPSELTTYSAD